MTKAMRALTADEINAVAGGQSVSVTQTNTGTATATSKDDKAEAKNTQVNFNVTGVEATVKVEKFKIL